ncbi:SSI family serine proteinase inhibitor [Actinomadura fulvescens]|uniref:Subtilisin inhibitor domain-containing protein n=1 Tax=Actinomadura fulvescens TaxID=46160 RepID=A0ABP6CZU7_9ACTN
MPHLIATALTGAALALLPAMAAPSAHAAAAPATWPTGHLRLTLTSPEANASGTRTATLLCGPDVGSHPEAAKACRELAARGGEIERDPADTACVLIYAPVVAAAEGHWQGRPVRFEQEYPNDCVMRAHTGQVFAF